ncbi:hypothetical protein ASG89_10020 [Paenibacillus sp. Soil766]|uniref:hypothetical protein n=1 Tax=Paenibacillus sp. Soil766 TaxID=1736404 RepID=UPI000710E2E7|nr:hypothetical protein [Paenibacillus sp. Soil766]KRE86347.1 hypothetical protein ASG89_10020 [Paenibacillus sp. Soil766]
MQTNSSQWLRRMREKHRRLFWKKRLEDQIQVLPEGESENRGQGNRMRVDQVLKKGKRIDRVLEKGEGKEQVQPIRSGVDHMQQTGDRVDHIQMTGSRNNVIPLEQRRIVSNRNPHPPTIAELEADVWELRKKFILQIANRRNGKVRLQEVAAECNVNVRVAAEWLIRLSMEGMLSLVAGQRYTMTYLVKEVARAQK